MFEDENIYYVGIGASAGGFDLVNSLVSELSKGRKDFCIIIIHHLSPNYKSELPGILSRETEWPVELIYNDSVLVGGKVYVVPPTRYMVFKDNRVFLDEDNPDVLVTPSIDKNFQAIANIAQSRGLGVLLSGYGNDGTKGVRAIKEKSGYVIVQSPDSAEVPEMPSNVVKSGYFDLECEVSDIGEEVIHYIEEHRKISNIQLNKESVNQILELLNRKTGTDFSQYKPNTIERRLAKRLESLSLSNASDYLKYINKDPNELNNLFQVILIGVTEFFRNMESYEKLKPVLREIIHQKKEGESLRIWSVGCASGEEPYSLAIMINELLGQDSKVNMQIFATDLDDRALAVGRKGIYLPQAVKSVPDNLLKKYFHKTETGYQIKSNLRQSILFSKHDISIDPPFVNQDLIICRNLLIYFNNFLQKETLKTFHYSLNENGYLFLGRSESVSVIPEIFSLIDNRNKIYKRITGELIYTLDYARFGRRKEQVNQEKETDKKLPPGFSLMDNAKESLYRHFENPFVVINEMGQIKEVKGSMRLYMEMTEGKADVNLIKMVNRELTVELRALIAKVKQTNAPQETNIVEFNLYGQVHYVKIRALPLVYEMFNTKHFLIVFRQIESEVPYLNLDKKYSPEELQDYRVEKLEHELKAARDHIETLIEELESRNIELQTLNEELQSANEEMKSANEELESSNEELQSANEELSTTNAELRKTNSSLLEKEKQLRLSKEQTLVSEQLYKTIALNFPNGTVGVVNKELRLEFIAGKGIQNYKPNEVDNLNGMLIYELNPDPTEQQKLKDLFKNAFNHIEGEVEVAHKNRMIKVYAIPLFLSSDGKIVEKVMYMSQNVSDYHDALMQVKESEERFRMLADTAPIMIWMEDENRKNIYQSKGWQDFTGTSSLDNIGEGWLEYIHPDDRDRVKKTFFKAFNNREHYSAEYRLRRYDGQYCWMMDHGTPRFDNLGKFIGYIGGCLDINDQKELERKKDEFMNLASHELKTPLTSALAYVDLSFRSTQEKNIDELPLYLDYAKLSLKKLNILINELLDVSRIELGKVRMNFELVSMDKLVKEIIRDLREIHVDYNLNISGETGVKIKADRRMLEQLITNLVSNAIKYSPIRTEVKILLSKTEEHVILEVEDHGIGMDQEVMKHIFSKFYQANVYETDGLGLGLYLSKSIVEAHQGTIEVESEPGKGSRFRVQLPLLMKEEKKKNTSIKTD